jgi:hypothetical protein
MHARKKLKAGHFAVGFPGKRDEAVLNAGGERCESVVWDFAVDGGAVGDISFARLLPAGAVVIGVVSHEITGATSGGSATVTLSAGSTALTGAVAVASVATGTIALASSATAIPLAADKVTVAEPPLVAPVIS